MRIVIISDIHANLVALEAVLKHADVEAADAVWCLGDIVGYGPEPNACVQVVQQITDGTSLAGNHDWAALGKIDVTDFNVDARRAALWTRSQLTAESRDFLTQLPTRMGPLHDDYTLAHGSPRYPVWEYILYPSVAAENFPYFDTRICFVGHTHTPVIFRYVDGDDAPQTLSPPVDTPLPLSRDDDDVRLIINPGSVGQPRDGNSDSSYAVLDLESNTLTYHRVSYDIAATQKQMREFGLPSRLITRLDYGW